MKKKPEKILIILLSLSICAIHIINNLDLLVPVFRLSPDVITINDCIDYNCSIAFIN